MKKLLISNLLISVCFILGTKSQTFEWALSMGSNVGESSAEAVEADGTGSVFIAGYYSGTIFYDPLSSGVSRANQGGRDLFIGKYDLNGSNDRFAYGGGLFDDQVNDLALDDAGNVYVTGSFMDFGSFFNPPNFLMSNGGKDIFIIKMDNTLNVIWIVQIGGTADDEGYGLTVDDAGNIYVTGSFQGTNVDFDPAAGVANVFAMSSAGGDDMFILKLDPAGNFLAAQQIGGLGNDRGMSIAHDGSNLVYATGYFESSVDFDPGLGSDIRASNGGKDAFVAAYTSALAHSWSVSMGGLSDDEGNELKLGVINDVFVTGYYNGTAINFGGGVSLTSQGEDGFLVKYTSLGTADWGFTVGGAAEDHGLGIALDGCDNSYLSGYFSGTVDFDPSANVSNLTAPTFPQNGYFVGKYNNGGGFLWAGNGGTNPMSSEARSIAVDELGTIFTTGLFASTGLDADITSGISAPTLSSIGAFSDIFLSRHAQSEIIVSNVNDDGNGSLRNAILLANAQIGADTIRFCLPGLAPHVIQLNTPLPALTDDSTVIDGPSQAGHSLGAIVLDGSLLAPGSAGISMANVTHCEIWGLSIQNFTDGISLSNADFIVIGGAGKENDISNNTRYGIYNNPSSQNNLFSQNSIYCNSTSGIELAGSGNGAITAPVITVPDVTGMDGTAPPNAIIEIYTQDTTSCPGAPCQGKTLIGTTTADGSGFWYLPGPLTLGDEVTAVAINSANNTSEFSLCQMVDAVLNAAPPVLSLYETGTRHIALRWLTDTDRDIASFEVEKLNATGSYEGLTEIKSWVGQQVFTYTDLNPSTGDNTYRIRQNMLDGSFQYSSAVNLALSPNEQFWVYPNPAQNSLNIDFVLERERPGGLGIRLLDHTGREVEQLHSNQLSDHIQLPVQQLSRGIYFLEVRLGSKLWEVRKIQLMP